MPAPQGAEILGWDGLDAGRYTPEDAAIAALLAALPLDGAGRAGVEAEARDVARGRLASEIIFNDLAMRKHPKD